MLLKAKELKGFSLKSIDGDIGSASEFFFDDQYWTIRYLVANTASWLSGKKVLISPYSVTGVNKDYQELAVELTKKQVENSPSIDTDKPVSRQYEGVYNGYYGYPNYWGGLYAWGGHPYIERDRANWRLSASEEMGWDRHLRSSNEVTGYHLSARDGEIGHVDDFIIDDETWTIRYLVVANLSWDAREVAIGLSRETIKAAPEYTDESLLTRDYETGLYGHYNREGYWVDELTAV